MQEWKDDKWLSQVAETTSIDAKQFEFGLPKNVSNRLSPDRTQLSAPNYFISQVQTRTKTYKGPHP